MDNRHLDTLFQEKLSTHEIQPSPSAWIKLEQQLEEKKKPLWLIWGNYAAGFLLLLGIGVGYQYWNNTPPESGSELVTEIVSITPDPVATMDSVTIPNISENSQTKQTIQKKNPPTTAPTFKPVEQVAALSPEPSERSVESLTPLEQHKEIWTEALAIDQVTIPLDLEEIIPEIQAPDKEIAYTVRIVSRGYAIAPEKGQIVDGIENKLEKIGGFFTKVDKGFGDLQDAKNDLLYQVVASKKEK